MYAAASLFIEKKTKKTPNNSKFHTVADLAHKSCHTFVTIEILCLFYDSWCIIVVRRVLKLGSEKVKQ